jgi:hypothetical protein
VTTDYYHIPCFELLADFTSPAYLDRIQPLTRNTFKLRGLKPSSVFDGSYLLPGGVERLILEWKVTRGKAIDKRDGVFDERMYKLEESIHELLYRAGSRAYRPVRRPGLLDQFEFYTLFKTLAPNEFEYTGGRNEEWNLFGSFLGEEDGVHDLSGMLERWEKAVVSLTFREERKSDVNRVRLSPGRTQEHLLRLVSRATTKINRPSPRQLSRRSGGYRRSPPHKLASIDFPLILNEDTCFR